MSSTIANLYNSIYALPGFSGSDPLAATLSALSNLGQTPAASDSATSRQSNASYQVKLSSLGQIRAAFSAFNSAESGLRDPKSVSPFSAATSVPSVATAAVAKSGGASGSYDINVSQLAKSQTLVTGTYNDADRTVVGTGRITIETGSYDAANNIFTPSGETATTIVVDASNNADGTLNSVATAINSANAGVKAEVESVSTGGYRLKITSTDTGTESTLRITVSDADSNSTDNSGLSVLAYNPTATASAGKNLTELAAAQNAAFTVNGKSYTSQSNEVSTAIKDVTLKLADTGAANVTVTRDFKSFQAATRKFASAYNALVGQMAEVMRQSAAAGASVKNERTKEVLADMHNTLEQTSSGVGGERLTLADIGVMSKANGKLEIDNNALEKSFAHNPDGAASLIATASRKLADIAGKFSESAPKAVAPSQPAFQPKMLAIGITAPQSLFDLGPATTGMFAPGKSFGGTGLYSFVHGL